MENTKGTGVTVVGTKEVDSYRPPQSLELPPTLELRQHGYLALARAWQSGVYNSSPELPSPLTSQASGQIDFVTAAAAAATLGEDNRGFRQSSIDSEPQTLPLISVRQAKDGAVEIIQTYDQEEAVHFFLKDAEDEHLREEALAAILPTSDFGLSS